MIFPCIPTPLYLENYGMQMSVINGVKGVGGIHELVKEVAEAEKIPEN